MCFHWECIHPLGAKGVEQHSVVLDFTEASIASVFLFSPTLFLKFLTYTFVVEVFWSWFVQVLKICLILANKRACTGTNEDLGETWVRIFLKWDGFLEVRHSNCSHEPIARRARRLWCCWRSTVIYLHIQCWENAFLFMLYYGLIYFSLFGLDIHELSLWDLLW